MSNSQDHPHEEQQSLGCAPAVGFLLLVAAMLVAFLVIARMPLNPGPGPAPEPWVTSSENADAAEVAGKLEDRLYADVFNALAKRTESGEIKSAEQWHAEAKEKLYQARFDAQKEVHLILDDAINKIPKDPKASAAVQRELARGYQRSGR